MRKQSKPFGKAAADASRAIGHQMQEVGAPHLGQQGAKLEAVGGKRIPCLAQRIGRVGLDESRKVGFVEGDIVEAPILEPLLAFFDEIEEVRNECRRWDGHLEPDLQH
ncbi:hypothetical protein NKJ08_03305 [Mesorhizobium sp. M0244]